MKTFPVSRICFLHRHSAVKALDFTTLHKSLWVKASVQTTKCQRGTKQIEMSVMAEIIHARKKQNKKQTERFDVCCFIPSRDRF